MLREERRGLIIEVKSERNLDINNFDNTQKVNVVVLLYTSILVLN